MGGESEQRSGEDGPGGAALKDIGDKLQPKSEDEGPYEEPRYSQIEDKRPKYHPPEDSIMSDVVETVKMSDHQPKQNPGVIGRITQSLNPFGPSEPSTIPEKVNEKQPSHKSETSREKKLQKEVTQLRTDKISLSTSLNNLSIKFNLQTKDLDGKRRLIKQWEDWKDKSDEHWRKQGDELRKTKDAYDRLFDDYRKLKRTKEDLETELDEEKDLNKSLRQDIQDQEVVVTEAHSRAISLLAGHVSSDFPDDQVRTELQDLFEKCSEWCIDNRLPLIENVDETRNLLITEGIINDPDGEEHLGFDVTHRTATAVLLQAALTKALVQTFLGNPFFLGQRCLNKAALQGGASAEATVTWRIQTCQYIEQAFPPHKEGLQACAEGFVRTYEPLIEPLDRESLTQLTKLFETTCSLALRLWKLRTNIRIEALGDATLHRFQSMFGDMEAHPTVGLLKGDKRFDGRPICVVVRPRIVSEPVESENRGRGIVWSPAQVWVSNWEDAGY
ncbi:hypothetical protein H9Q69_012348 [Fusarium xylarioides]|uniref:Uncharacterized protein n=1 Tax=Fusarium xylarioides TaxID=221167 RepID=A0A9P7KVC0_9HYPO|nr:hypothetical protein H9Q70_011889 [Fusarium xylarioides]KAG5758566.1 hypothetical protein H9Q72_013301 [Fusarium xylarioides]KAG5773069.1 hypothetical protein H9Q73_012277 [Fusarium xylarioides]KAG5788595.1 hypothetical protein H9Q69_012348 [Fusarium xylarioides]KAG5802675.1 hypothetical protein H9Q71_012744 [Fusarium xylarioides]